MRTADKNIGSVKWIVSVYVTTYKCASNYKREPAASKKYTLLSFLNCVNSAKYKIIPTNK
jgi:hypothetical protein